MSHAISLRSVSKVYAGNITAVDRLSLDVDPGEFLVLLGPSGCGKSTVLRMIAGLTGPTRGDVYLDGRWANDLSPKERKLAMVFQNHALYPHMTTRENIGFPLRMESPHQDPGPRVEEVARTLGIGDLLDRHPSELSGGERQRVAMGRAMVRRPSAFLLDEPLSSLDAKLRNRLRAEIATLTRQLGVTTVYVTHDQAEAMSLGHRVAVMRDGTLMQVGTAPEVYRLPRHVFVAAFVGTPRINLLRARIVAPLGQPMSVDLGGQRIELVEPLSPDHQMLRVQMGSEVTVGLRSEAVRIASEWERRPHEVTLHGTVEHVEFQGHESLVHVDVGAAPAPVAGLESARRPPRRRREQARPVMRLLTQGERQPAEQPPEPGSDDPTIGPTARVAGHLVLRAPVEVQPRAGDRVPLQIDLGQMYVFDAQGERVCPAPLRAPVLGPN